MKMICSASKGVSAKVDTANTFLLLQCLRQYSLEAELVLGTWQGKREISVVVTGFDHFSDMQDLGAYICSRWNQDVVYYSVAGNAYTVDAHGVIERAGVEAMGIDVPTGTKAYTQYLDGRCLYTLTKEVETNGL
jgi:hypothetical protein